MEITGRIINLDDLHIEVADDEGHFHRFAIAMDALIDAGELPRMKHLATRVVVVYDEDTPEIAVAHRVFPVPYQATSPPQ